MLKKRFWTTKNIIFTILVIVLLLMLPKIVGILMLFFGAYVIACALNPYVSKLMKKMKNRTVAASVVLFSSIAAIIALFIPIAFVAYKEIKTFLTTMPVEGAPPGLEPEQQVLDTLGAEELTRMILDLREPYKTPCRLVLLEQHTMAEAARLCGRPEKTVNAQIYRAKKMLVQQIREQQEGRSVHGTV